MKHKHGPVRAFEVTVLQMGDGSWMARACAPDRPGVCEHVYDFETAEGAAQHAILAATLAKADDE